MNFRILVLTIFSVTTIYFLNACKKIEEADDSSLAVTVSPKSTYILPSEDVTKCSSSTSLLSPNIVEFNSLTFQWGSSTSSVQILNVSLIAKSPLLAGGEYSCSIGGNELIALLPTRTIAAGVSNPVSTSTLCSMRCGSVAVLSGASSATIPGTIKILAIETLSSDGTQIPFSKSVDVSLIYKKF